MTEENGSLSCLAVNERNVDDIWYLDSGCSNHMTGDKGLFVEMDDPVAGSNGGQSASESAWKRHHRS